MMKSTFIARQMVLLFNLFLLLTCSPALKVYATEENAPVVVEEAAEETSVDESVAEEDSILTQGTDKLKETGTKIQEAGIEAGNKVKNLGAYGLRQIIGIIPFVGVVLFLIGVCVAVFSVRNKGNKRWGLKLAVSEVLITYLLYIGFTLAYDVALKRYSVHVTSRPEQTTVFEEAYYNAVEELTEEKQNYLFLESGWVKKAATANRRVYADVAYGLAFVSFSSGILLLIVTRRDRAIRRLAFAGMCVVIPAALIVGYQYLKF